MNAYAGTARLPKLGRGVLVWVPVTDRRKIDAINRQLGGYASFSIFNGASLRTAFGEVRFNNAKREWEELR